MISNIQVDYLGKEKVDKIMDAVYRIMEEIGEDIYCDEAIELLKSNGCTVEKSRVKIPRELVKKCLKMIPNSIMIYDRNGKEAMNLGGRDSYFGGGPTCPSFIDPMTGERRRSRKEDAANTAIVSDYLPNMDFVMSLVSIGDQTEELADIHEADAMMRNTTKPIATWAFTADHMARIFDMAEVVAGGKKELKEKPFVVVYSEPTTPLTHTKDAVEKLIVAARYGVPCIYTPGIIMGAAGPTTVAGTLAVGMSECLTGLVIHQLISPGAPFIGGVGSSPMDMKTMQAPYGTPEGAMCITASNEIMRSLGIPAFDLAGATDSKVVDAQAGMECMLQFMVSLLGGGNMIHDSGFTDIGMTGSLTHLVACDEMIRMAKRIGEGIEVNDDTIGFEAIKEVGPGKDFLSTLHTFNYFRKEHHDVNVIERRDYADWESDGCKTYDVRASEKVREILSNHKPETLSPEIIKKLDEMVADAEKEAKENSILE